MLGKNYLDSITKNHDYIKMSERIFEGMPSVKGEDIPVSLIITCLRDGLSINEICQQYNLTEEVVIACIEYTIDVLNKPFDKEQGY